MNIHPFRPAMPSRRWLLALAWAGLAALAGGCATQPGGDIPPELQTASDESDARKRARTRLALAAGYYENGQHMVALDEQKRALQADPNYPDAYNLGGLIYMALLARMTRSTMLEVLAEDYIRTARAKGVSSQRLLLRHALKNAAVPIVTTIGLGIAMLLSGVIVTESVFAIPGIGRLTVDSILRRDYPVIQGIVLVTASAYVAINLVTDLLYGLFDPRIRY